MANSELPGIKDYLNTSEEPVEVPALGAMVRDGRASLGDGESVSGAEVVELSPHSPAAKALGTHEVSHVLVNGALIGAGVASAVLFPPAIVVVAMIAHSDLGRSYDLVVGIDGYRVRNTMDLMQSVADVRSGDTVYVAIVRSGHRLQIPVHVQ
jgi:S1-C subfamily serine protease